MRPQLLIEKRELELPHEGHKLDSNLPLLGQPSGLVQLVGKLPKFI